LKCRRPPSASGRRYGIRRPDERRFSGGYDGGSSDSVTEVTTTGWLQRLLQSLIGVLIGILLVIGSIVLLWWNEGRAVEAIRALDQGARQIVEINSTAVDGAAEGKLVHLSGPMTTSPPAVDTAFGIGGEGLLRLKRTVEMYQWSEEKSSHSQTNVGGSKTTETTYSYKKEWSENAHDSSRFHEANGHQNPPLPVSTTIDSTDVRLGAYRVDPSVLDNVSEFAPFDPPQNATLPAGYRRENGVLYRGRDSGNPAIGDIRIRYTAVSSQTMSVVAAQAGGVLTRYRAANGYQIALADAGVAPVVTMFHEKKQEESLWTWILRGVDFVLMLIGFILMASPLSVAASVIPFLGDLVGMGAFLLGVVIAVPLTLLVIAAAWIAHRPLIGGGLIIAAAGLFYLLARLRRRPVAAAAPAVR
jgi:hypothetical protein